MDGIILSEVGVTEFVAYFSKLSHPMKMAFAKERRGEILALHNADILDYLCAKGFFNYLADLFEIGDADQTAEAFYQFYGRVRQVWLRPSRADERKVIVAAAKREELVRFLREDTNFFWSDGNDRIFLRRLVYENTSVAVLDYLFLWAVRNDISVSKVSGLQLFGRANAQVIRRYISKIAFFSGSYRGISFLHIKALYDRKDLSRDVKLELIFSAVNNFHVSESVITQMRKAGMFNG